MIMPEEKRFKFFVFIIESPSPQDLYHGRGEGELLRRAVSLNGIPCLSRTAVNIDALVASVHIGLSEEMKANPGLSPILHISAHGSADGIQLTSGETLRWRGLRELLKPLNKALNGGLLVCMSTCQGYSGSRMAMYLEDQDDPFFGIVGNGKNPTWPETAVAFATFYHLIANGHFVVDAVNAMCVASGNENFFVTTAAEAKQSFSDYMRTVDTQAATRQLEAGESRQASGELAKRLRSIQSTESN